MSSYQPFENEFDSNNRNSAAILPEIDADEVFQLEFSSQTHSYPSNYSKLKYFCLRRTILERFSLSLIILLLIILSIITIVFLSYSKTRSVNSLCLTQSCIELSYLLSIGINRSIDPCEDFHEHVCGNWMKKNIIPKGYSQWSPLQKLSQDNMIIIRNILEQTSSLSSLSDAEQQTIKYYRSCMNQTEIERLQNQPLERFFQTDLNFTLKQWIDLDKNQTYTKLFSYFIRLFSNRYGFSSLFPIIIDADEKNSTWNNIHVYQPDLLLGSRDYYLQSTTNDHSNERNRIIRETFITVGSDILQLLGFEKNDSITRLSDILQLESDLALVNLPMEILQKPNETYNLMSLKQLQEYYQSIDFDIYSFFNEMLNINLTNPIKLNENDKIIVLSYEQMFNTSKILTNYLLTNNKSYIIIDRLLFSFIMRKISYLSSEFEKVSLPLKKELHGIDALAERWEDCIKATDTSFGFGLGALYLRAVFNEDDRSKANELVEHIRSTFDENLEKLQWIDELTKNVAKKKLKNMNQKIGYPDFVKNQTELNERYAAYVINENEYFNNGIKVTMREHRRHILKYRQKVDINNNWAMTPSTVNAYYQTSLNEIVFPAGILQPPFFHKDLPLAINYGAIGSIIGHEITHGFDDQGREFDENGNMIPWWTNFAVKNFEEKSKCFIEQYSNFSIDGQTINGQRTLGENIADNSGIKLSYFSYQKHKNHYIIDINNDIRLPALDYTDDQLFFIAFAHVWCGIQSPNSLHEQIVTDPHAPKRIRVTGTLQNSDEFAKAFSCKSKAVMNPSNKCQLW